MTEKDIEILKQLAKKNYGKVLQKYLQEELKKMCDIENLTQENLEARKEAVKIVRKLFWFLEKFGQDSPETRKNPYL